MKLKLGGMNVEFEEIGSRSGNASLFDFDEMEIPYLATFSGLHSFAEIRGVASRGEIIDWLSSIESLYANPTKQVKLAFYEPTFVVSLDGQKTGQIEMTCEVSNDEAWEMHRFNYSVDQSYLPEMIQGLRSFLSATR